jgi:hypothetical protein
MKNNNVDVYKLYFDWCTKQNETPLKRDEFENLADSSGSINLADLMKKHQGFSLENSKSTQIVQESKGIKDHSIEITEQEAKFITSAVSSYATNSTLKGAFFGGSWIGDMLGKLLRNEK